MYFRRIVTSSDDKTGLKVAESVTRIIRETNSKIIVRTLRISAAIGSKAFLEPSGSDIVVYFRMLHYPLLLLLLIHGNRRLMIIII